MPHQKQGFSVRRGFTLIELLIVVAIIAILAAIAVPNFLEAQTRAKVSRVKSDMRSIATAFESYHVDNNVYPESAIFAGETWAANFATSIPRYVGVGGMKETTTPIAYLSSNPPDSFPIREAWSSVSTINQETLGRTDRPFYYLNIKNYSNPVTGYVEQVAAGSQWVMHSWGPSGLSWGAGGPSGLITTYDPTNGTISRGSISRYGPGQYHYYD